MAGMTTDLMYLFSDAGSGWVEAGGAGGRGTVDGAGDGLHEDVVCGGGDGGGAGRGYCVTGLRGIAGADHDERETGGGEGGDCVCVGVAFVGEVGGDAARGIEHHGPDIAGSAGRVEWNGFFHIAGVTMSVSIQTINLTKRYNVGGTVLLALNNLKKKIEEGDCFGFIGPNGAGKSTTIKILATLLQPTWGEARICNYVVGYESRKIRPLIGYVPDSFGAYEDMVVQEYLEFFAAAYDINGAKRKQIVDDVLNLTDLGYKRDAMVDSLSKGMQQRLSLARVLLHDPRVLLLDEPASGLDPRARIEIRELLKELKKMGKTILISSHILPELADLCNKVGIIERGELVFAGTVEAAVRKASLGQVFYVGVAERTADAANLLRGTAGIAGVAIEDNVMHVTVNTDVTDTSFIAQKLIGENYRLTLLREEEVNLETAFMRLTKGIVQ